jgi:hypothetical protein
MVKRHLRCVITSSAGSAASIQHGALSGSIRVTADFQSQQCCLGRMLPQVVGNGKSCQMHGQLAGL